MSKSTNFQWRLMLPSWLINSSKRPSKRTSFEDEDVVNNGKNPWADTLTRLAAQMPAGSEVLTNELPVELTEMARERAEDQEIKEEKAEFAEKKRRAGDPTLSDIRAWWGQSLATYNPDDGKDLDMIDQKPRGRTADHWFGR